MRAMFVMCLVLLACFSLGPLVSRCGVEGAAMTGPATLEELAEFRMSLLRLLPANDHPTNTNHP